MNQIYDLFLYVLKQRKKVAFALESFTNNIIIVQQRRTRWSIIFIISFVQDIFCYSPFFCDNCIFLFNKQTNILYYIFVS